MINYKNPLSSQSYTNQDFSLIFPELLETVKKLTYQWDPSISNESDPGVILLKLNALIADKCNYNADSNVLETFPVSVTQISNARNMYGQLGYYMHWYKSATTDINIRWTGTIDESKSYTIPAFTMVSDDDTEYIYTLIGPASNSTGDNLVVHDMELPLTGDDIAFKAIEGTVMQYSLNGETTITADMLDQNNRIYFVTSDIAENGIFISNIGDENYNSWKKVNNLITENLGTFCYKFGVCSDTNRCYLEFPEDAPDIIKNGIQITYIKTKNVNGNILPEFITKFYSDLTVKTSDNQTDILTKDNTFIINYSSADNGQDYESLEEAYTGYHRIVGTYDTLITLRDYINYLLRSGLVSNCFVCDRTNDIQCQYNVISNNNGISQIYSYVDDNTLTAFSLKLYLLNYVPRISNGDKYQQAYEMFGNLGRANIVSSLQDIKSISHDIENILPVAPGDNISSPSRSHFCFFKNKFPLQCQIIPQYALTQSQSLEIKANIISNLLSKLNSKELDFGESITLDTLYQTIKESDQRIKTVVMGNIESQAYAVYYNNTVDDSGKIIDEWFDEIEISTEDDSPVVYNYDFSTTPVYSAQNIYDEGDICQYLKRRYICTTQISTPESFNKAHWELYEVSVEIDPETFQEELGLCNYSTKEFNYADGDWDEDLDDFGITLTGTPVAGDKLSVNVSLKTQFRDEIYTKSVLGGSTQFLKDDSQFKISLSQTAMTGYTTELIEDIAQVKTDLTVPITKANNQYTLSENERIQLYSPRIIASQPYGKNVKVEWHFTKPVFNGDYKELSSEEFILFYWKNSEDDVLYTYKGWGQGAVVNPIGLDLSENSSTSEGYSLWNATGIEKKNEGTESYPIYTVSTEYNGAMSSAIAQNIQNKVTSSNGLVLSSNKTIDIDKLNRLEFDTSYYCYWVLNSQSEDGKYVLFDDESQELTYTLQSGEYFFYADNQLVNFESLGAGTTITRPDTSSTWSVNAIDISDIYEHGMSAFINNGLWKKCQNGLSAVENQFINLNQGYVLSLERNDGSQDDWSVSIGTNGMTFEPSTISLSNFDLRYKENSNSNWIKVQNFSADSSNNWSARAYLDLELNSSRGCRLITKNGRGKLYYRYKNSDSWETIESVGATSSGYPVVLYSLHDIQIYGGSITSTIWNNLNRIEYLSLYKFSEKISESNRLSYLEDGGASFDFKINENTNSRSIEFMIPNGLYTISAYDSSDSTTNTSAIFKVELDNVELSPIYSDQAISLKTHTVYNLNFDIDDEEPTTHTLTVTKVSGYTDNTTIKIGAPYKYRKPDIFSDFQFNKIKKLIKIFDKDNLFDYTYRVAVDDNIENPCLGSSFLKDSHIYNKFTICQLDLSNLAGDIVVTGVK